MMIFRPVLIVVLLLALGAAAWWGVTSKKKSSLSAVPAPIAQEQASAPSPPAAPAASQPPLSQEGAQTVPVSNPDSATPAEFWTKRCDEKISHCEIFQRLVLNENNIRLIEFAVGYPKDKDMAEAVIVLPLGIVMTDGIFLKLDDGAPSKAMVRTCTQDGCFIVMNLPADFIQKMKTSGKITVTFMDGAAKQVNVELSLEGFADKLALLKS